MALIFEGKSECSICNKVLYSIENIIGWKPFLRQGHKFWEYSDSGMHQQCFDKWEHREEFEDLYKYQPLIDFEDIEFKKQINKLGMPDWLKEIKGYRKNNPMRDIKG